MQYRPAAIRAPDAAPKAPLKTTVRGCSTREDEVAPLAPVISTVLRLRSTKYNVGRAMPERNQGETESKFVSVYGPPFLGGGNKFVSVYGPPLLGGGNKFVSVYATDRTNRKFVDGPVCQLMFGLLELRRREAE